jgi:ankyrin repeat protein
MYYHIDMMKLLCEHKADPNIKDHGGCTPLHEAVKVPQVQITQLLLIYGADPNSKDGNGATPVDMMNNAWRRRGIVVASNEGIELPPQHEQCLQMLLAAQSVPHLLSRLRSFVH